MPNNSIKKINVVYQNRKATILLKKKEKRTIYNGLATECIELLFFCSEALGIIKDITKDPLSEVMNCTISSNQYTGHRECSLEILAKNFDTYFKELSNSPIVGKTLHISVSGQPLNTPGNTGYTYKAQPLNATSVGVELDLPKKPKCDCGAAACGHPEPGPAHSSWCSLMQQELPA